MKRKIIAFSIFLSLIFTVNNSFALKIKSDDIRVGKQIDNKFVFNGFGCEGENQSPHLEISNIPKEARSLAITMYDPDAPTGSGWWHWIVYNIAPTLTSINSGDTRLLEDASYGRNDYGKYEYGGPCPPKGSKHNYIFTIYALDISRLDLPQDASAALIGYNLNAHTIKKAQLRATYKRKK